MGLPVNLPTPKLTDPSGPGPRNGWPYVIAAVITLAIQSGWQPADVRALALALMTAIVIISVYRPG